MGKGRKHAASFRNKMALSSLAGDKTSTELGRKLEVNIY
jgi:hypothetical protein